MSGRYPLLVDAARLRVLVVGGGEVALRKVRSLVDADGRPDIIAPEALPDLVELIDGNGLDWRRRTYEAGDARGYTLVFAATDSAEVNAAISSEANSIGALVNVADDGDGSTFHVPSVIRQGEVVVALGTGGASPLLSRRLRERLETVITPGLGRAAGRLSTVRRVLRERWPADEQRRRSAWFGLVTPEFLDAAIAGRDDDVENRITRCLSQS